MPRYGGSQAKRRKEARAQLGLEQQAGGSTIHKGRDVRQIATGRAYDPAKRAQVMTKNEQFAKAMSSEPAEARFRDRANIKAMRERAETFKKGYSASETMEQYARRMRKKRGM